MTKHWDDDREQDWEPVVLRRDNNNNNNNNNVQTQNSNKFEWHFINTVKQTRIQRGWSRKFLADKITVDATEIESFEKGDLNFDNKMKSDLIRVLGMKL